MSKEKKKDPVFQQVALLSCKALLTCLQSAHLARILLILSKSNPSLCHKVAPNYLYFTNSLFYLQIDGGDDDDGYQF